MLQFIDVTTFFCQYSYLLYRVISTWNYLNDWISKHETNWW